MNITGRWIGETQGCNTQLHFWVLIQRNNILSIYTRWENEPTLTLLADNVLITGNNFIPYYSEKDRQAIVQGSNSFIINKWVLEGDGTRLIPKYDVLFHRKDIGIKRILFYILLNILIFLRDLREIFLLTKITKDPILLIT